MSLGRDYTLVLDLDETLVHYDEEQEALYFRPGVQDFCVKMAQHFELVIFTAGMEEYANWAIDSLHEQI